MQISNNGSDRNRTQSSNDCLADAADRNQEFGVESGAHQPSDAMAECLKEHMIVHPHGIQKDVEKPEKLKDPKYAHQPRTLKNGVPASSREKVRDGPSRTEIAHQKDPEAPVEIPSCLVEHHIESLTPFMAFDPQDDFTSWDEHLFFDSVSPPHYTRSRLNSDFDPFSFQGIDLDSRTKLVFRDDIELDRSKPMDLFPSSSDTMDAFAKLVSARYATIADGALTQEMLWEREALEDPKPKAPVTKENLRELDLQSIQNTITLRYDLCFDQGLYFQRVTGLKGFQKRAKARIFYRYMSLELQAINHDIRQDLGGPCEACQNSKLPRYTMRSRLSCYFSSLLDLLLILVPESEKKRITEVIDPTWLTQRVRTGSFDAQIFSSWLHALLTRHCAPMRDAMAREMHEKLSLGASSGDMDLLADGMEVLLCLLENMKIDIANHQIRTFKLLLIADTVSFLKDCFKKMYSNNHAQLQDSRIWFHNLKRVPGQSKFENFMQGFIELLCKPEKDFEPTTTFRHSEPRIQNLRNEILDYAHLEICMTTCRERYSGNASVHIGLDALKCRIVQLMSNVEGTSEGVRQHAEAIDLEISKAADQMRDAEMEDIFHLHSTKTADVADCMFEPHLEYMLDTAEDRELELLSKKLLEPTLTMAKNFLKMDTLQISNYQRARQDQRTNKGMEVSAPDIADLSSKVAHMGVIHWQIWANLAYLRFPDVGIDQL